MERTGYAEVSIQICEEKPRLSNYLTISKLFCRFPMDVICNLGSMNLNRLREIKRIKGEKFRFSVLGDTNEDSSDDDEVDE